MENPDIFIPRNSSWFGFKKPMSIFHSNEWLQHFIQVSSYIYGASARQIMARSQKWENPNAKTPKQAGKYTTSWLYRRCNLKNQNWLSAKTKEALGTQARTLVASISITRPLCQYLAPEHSLALCYITYKSTCYGVAHVFWLLISSTLHTALTHSQGTYTF